jgi:3-hydroxyisobutyrate dehydrogenase-like beta-hydroxyacid dehydrogenase
MRIGFVGLGDQGGAIARALIEAGHDLTVWARRAQAAEGLCAAGARWAETPAVLPENCDLVALCVTDGAAVHDVLFERGLLNSMQPGTVLAIHSTIAPASIEQIAAAAVTCDVRVLDAPVAGGSAGVYHRRLALLLGGDQHDADRIMSAYASFCDPMMLVGAAGEATRIKLLSNLKFAIDVALGCQMLRTAGDYNLQGDHLRSALAAATGRSHALDAFPRMVREGRASHVADMLEKDVALAVAAFGDSVPQSWSALANEGLACLRRGS